MNKLHPATMIVAFLPKLYEAFRSILPFVAISYLSGRGDRTEIFIAAIGVLGGFGAIATYLTTRYGVEDSQLICTSGWLFKRDRRIPLDKIQNLNIRQGVLERLLKVVTLEVETAAGSGAELKLQVVTEEAAERLRAELSIVSAHKAEVIPESDVIYRMSKKDLLFGAMTENQGTQVIFALIGSVGAAAITQAASRFLQIKQYVPAWVLWGGTAAAILLVLFAGWIYGGFQYAIRYAFFTVRQEPGMFRVTHGFFTKLQYAVRIERVEMALVSTTVWQRLVKACTVRVGTAGTFGEQGRTVPIAMMLPEMRVTETLRSVLPQYREETLVWKPLPRYYLWASFARSILIALVIVGVSSLLFRAMPIHIVQDVRLISIVGIGLLFLLIWIDKLVSYRKAAYAISKEMLVVRTGFFRQSTTLMPISRIDTVGTSEPSWWRRRGVTTLTANGMVQHLSIPMLPEEDAEKIRQMILGRRP